MNGNPGNFSDPESGGRASSDFDRRQGSSSTRRGGRSATGGRASNADGPVDERAARPNFALDPWSILRPAAKRWYWLLFAGVIGAAGGAMLGISLKKTTYSATAQIVEYKPPVSTDAYTPQQLVGPTLVGMIKSPEIMRGIAKKMAAAGKQVPGYVDANPERQSQIVTIKATAAEPRAAIELANMYNEEVIEFTRQHQRKEAEEADTFVTADIETTEKDLRAAQKAVPQLPATMIAAIESDRGSRFAATPNALAKQTEQLEAAREKLNDLLVKYTDNHPMVKAQRELIADLQTRLELKMTSAPAAGAPARPATSTSPETATTETPASLNPVTRDEYEMAVYKMRNLDNRLSLLLARQHAIQVFKNSPPGNFRVMQPANSETVSRHDPFVTIALLSGFFGLLGMTLAAGELFRRELFDTRLKTESDVARVTGLPVLANLGDIRQMSLATRDTWAFRAWIALQDRLAYSPNHGLICGITSSNSGDGRSTWIGLLAGAARKCGFRVLTIATKQTADAPVMSEDVPEPQTEASDASASEPMQAEAETAGATAGEQRRARAANSAARDAAYGGIDRDVNGHSTTAVMTHPNDLGGGQGQGFGGESDFTAMTASALFTPAMVTEKLMGSETDPLVHIPLPGWTWNLERRKQWQGALNVWRKIDNVVILVELPPASMPESVLLASNLPNLLWLAEAGKSDATDTRAQLQTLRHARCNLVGAVINRAMAPVAGGRFSRWVGCIALLGLFGLTGRDLVAVEADRPAATFAAATVQPGPGGSTFSVTSPAQRAQWQQKLTLGAGDVVNISLFGDPEAARSEVPIGPDGRVSFLEAQNVMAAGLTVDEFRDKLNEELSKFRRAPQAYVVPVSYKSKKYFVLGKVTQRGAFPLDRPMTLLEAVARAGGMETGLAADRSMIELADLSRAFVARNNQRLSVDFEKLFAQGDLSQNITLEPNDYIYFPAGGEKEVYVLGAVRFPGSYVYTTSTGALGAVAARGGFSERAWQKKVVVIRGGLGRPETFALDANQVLSAQVADLKLQPKDIVFVSERPWIRAEELLEAAANAFVTSAVVTWTGEKVTR